MSRIKLTLPSNILPLSKVPSSLHVAPRSNALASCIILQIKLFDSPTPRAKQLYLSDRKCFYEIKFEPCISSSISFKLKMNLALLDLQLYQMEIITSPLKNPFQFILDQLKITKFQCEKLVNDNNCQNSIQFSYLLLGVLLEELKTLKINFAAESIRILIRMILNWFDTKVYQRNSENKWAMVLLKMHLTLNEFQKNIPSQFGASKKASEDKNMKTKIFAVLSELDYGKTEQILHQIKRLKVFPDANFLLKQLVGVFNDFRCEFSMQQLMIIQKSDIFEENTIIKFSKTKSLRNLNLSNNLFLSMEKKDNLFLKRRHEFRFNSQKAKHRLSTPIKQDTKQIKQTKLKLFFCHRPTDQPHRYQKQSMLNLETHQKVVHEVTSLKINIPSQKQSWVETDKEKRTLIKQMPSSQKGEPNGERDIMKRKEIKESEMKVDLKKEADMKTIFDESQIGKLQVETPYYQGGRVLIFHKIKKAESNHHLEFSHHNTRYLCCLNLKATLAHLSSSIDQLLTQYNHSFLLFLSHRKIILYHAKINQSINTPDRLVESNLEQTDFEQTDCLSVRINSDSLSKKIKQHTLIKIAQWLNKKHSSECDEIKVEQMKVSHRKEENKRLQKMSQSNVMREQLKWWQLKQSLTKSSAYPLIKLYERKYKLRANSLYFNLHFRISSESPLEEHIAVNECQCYLFVSLECKFGKIYQIISAPTLFLPLIRDLVANEYRNCKQLIPQPFKGKVVVGNEWERLLTNKRVMKASFETLTVKNERSGFSLVRYSIVKDHAIVLVVVETASNKYFTWVSIHEWNQSFQMNSPNSLSRCHKDNAKITKPSVQITISATQSFITIATQIYHLRHYQRKYAFYSQRHFILSFQLKSCLKQVLLTYSLAQKRHLFLNAYVVDLTQANLSIQHLKKITNLNHSRKFICNRDQHIWEIQIKPEQPEFYQFSQYGSMLKKDNKIISFQDLSLFQINVIHKKLTGLPLLRNRKIASRMQKAFQCCFQSK